MFLLTQTLRTPVVKIKVLVNSFLRPLTMVMDKTKHSFSEEKIENTLKIAMLSKNCSNLPDLSTEVTFVTPTV